MRMQRVECLERLLVVCIECGGGGGGVDAGWKEMLEVRCCTNGTEWNRGRWERRQMALEPGVGAGVK
jgi:hypothetical protein